MQVITRRLASVVLLLGLFGTTATAQLHTRLYACALANDDPAAFMGGSSIGGGLWSSDDSGVTWKHIGWTHVKCYAVDIVDSSFGKTLYLACGNGLMRSIDAGEHWRMLTDWRITEVMDVAIDQQRPARLAIATATGNWTSIDSGEHWSELGPREFHAHLPRDSSVVPTHEWNETLLSDGRTAILTSEGGVRVDGKQLVRPIIQRGALWSIGSLNDDIFVGGERGIYHVDGANLTHLIFGGPHNVHDLLPIGDRLIIASLSGGIWRATNVEKELRFEQIGIPTLQMWSLHSAIVQE